MKVGVKRRESASQGIRWSKCPRLRLSLVGSDSAMDSFDLRQTLPRHSHPKHIAVEGRLLLFYSIQPSRLLAARWRI